MSAPIPLNLLSFSGNIRVLHLTWFAFFITFVVWFSHAPLMASIQKTFQLSDQEVKTLLILNVALTIPARIIVGMLVDSFGPASDLCISPVRFRVTVYRLCLCHDL